MKQRKEDCRSLKTKKNIRTAVAEFMRKKEVSRITVSEVAARAGVSRGTFYLHFDSIAGVVEQIEQGIIDDVCAVLDEYPPDEYLATPVPLISRVWEYLTGNYEFHRVLLSRGEGSSGLLDKLRAVITERYLDCNPYDYSADPARRSYVTFAISGIAGVVERWFTERSPVPADELERMLETVILAGKNALAK